MAAAGGDFGVLSDTVALRDGDLPHAELLAALRDPALHAWEPPGGGENGALSHAVIHSLDVTLPLDLPPVAPEEAVRTLVDLLRASDGAWFGVPPSDDRLPGATPPEQVAVLAGRSLG
jgi:hypothetical protein